MRRFVFIETLPLTTAIGVAVYHRILGASLSTALLIALCGAALMVVLMLYRLISYLVALHQLNAVVEKLHDLLDNVFGSAASTKPRK